MIGFKGFDKDLKCREFQFEIGKEYAHEGDAKLCKSGFHFCESPLDVFGYYDPASSRYADVSADSVSEETRSEDTQRVAKSLSIRAELTLSGLIAAGVKFILEKVDFTNAPATNTGAWSAATNTGYGSAATNTGNWSAATNTGDSSAATNTGDRSAATNTGYGSAATNTGNRSAATNTGDRSAATNTGNRSAATNTGEEGCAISLGIEGHAKAVAGGWLTLAEWKKINGEWHRIDVQTVKVDGEAIKADVFYQLRGGKFCEWNGD